MKKRYVLAGLLILVLALSLLATSFVSARPSNDVMTSHLITIPEGSTHSDYDGDFVSEDVSIDLQTGWTTNIPYSACAIAVRLSMCDNSEDLYAILRPSSTGAYAVIARTQVADVWTDSAGIVPIVDDGDLYLDVSNGAYVAIEITGYWLCDEYIRPTLTPGK